jgi:hypothetical protein
MASGASYKIEGGAELADGLKRAADKLSKLDHSEANEVEAGAAAHLAPMDSGYLAGSVTPLPSDEGGIFSDAEYAAIIEFGWPPHHIEPEPYAVPGVKDSAGEWMPLYAAQIQAILNDVHGA